MIDPDPQYAEYLLPEMDGAFAKGRIFGPQEVIKLKALDGVEVPLWEVFEVEGPGEQE